MHWIIISNYFSLIYFYNICFNFTMAFLPKKPRAVGYYHITIYICLNVPNFVNMCTLGNMHVFCTLYHLEKLSCFCTYGDLK